MDTCSPGGDSENKVCSNKEADDYYDNTWSGAFKSTAELTGNTPDPSRGVAADLHSLLHILITGFRQCTGNSEKPFMHPTRFPVQVLLILFLTHSPAMAAGAADAATQAPDSGAWLLVIIIGIVIIVIAAGVLAYSFRLVRAFEENTSSLIGALKALTPMPVVTLSDRIPYGVDGSLEVRIAGFSSSPLGQVTVVMAPPPGLALENDHITLPGLDTGETKIFRVGHGPARKGRYPVRITVLYRSADQERTIEFTRTVYAGIPAGRETID